MEFIAEILMEILGEAIMEGGETAASSRRLPRWARILALAGLVLFYAALFTILTLVGIAALRNQGALWISLIVFALAGLLVFMVVHKLHKILRTFSKK